VRVDPIKRTLKVPETKLLKLQCDILLSTYTFKFNLRRYVKSIATFDKDALLFFPDVLECADPAAYRSAAGAYTRPLFSST